MSAHLSIVTRAREPLGTPDQVVARIAAAAPEVQWIEGHSSFEEAKTVAALQLPWTDEQRAVFSLPKRAGTCEGEGYSARLYGFESCPLSSVTVEVVGEGNPLPFLRKVCRPNGWIVLGHVGREALAIDLEGDLSSEWRTFVQRDLASKALVGPPVKLRIPAEGPVEYVGRLEDGTQYMAFITGAVPDGYTFDRGEEWRKVKRWIGVLHLFDADGNHLRSEARHGGFDIEGWDAACDKAWAEVHAMFTPHRAKSPKRCDISVKPFSVVIDGITHGLAYRATQAEEDGPVFEGVFLEPRDVMFHPPWDSGEWST